MMADESDDEDAVSPEAQSRFQAALEAGVLKILSKMGIATVDSYRGAQIFEVVGLGPEVVDVCFRGTPSIVGGLGWEHLGEDVLRRHRAAYPDATLDSPGWIRVRKGGEYHAHSKEVVQALNDLTLVQETADDPRDLDVAAAHLLQRGRDDKNSRIKQIASGRFGVTPEYLAAAADELQIKMAQGSKPGEGGQLPGHKVTGRSPGCATASPACR
jgi:glutamate synthase domain-containing protein 2